MLEVQQIEKHELDIDKLMAESNSFFDLHWNEKALGLPPEWKSWETFLDGSVPNYQYGGCYALFSGDELVYLGLGASRGGGIYPQHGISRRLMAHGLRFHFEHMGFNFRHFKKIFRNYFDLQKISSSPFAALGPALMPEIYFVGKKANNSSQPTAYGGG